MELSSTEAAVLTLFQALPIHDQTAQRQPSEEVTKASLEHGFVFDPVVAAAYSDSELLGRIPGISARLGITPAQMNATFYESWEKVRMAPEFILRIEQAMHYMSTYGAELVGEYSEDRIYIPFRQDNLPDSTLCLRVIHGLTKQEIKEKVADLLRSGIALKEESLDAILEIAKMDVGFPHAFYAASRNEEATVRLAVEYSIQQNGPVDLLRSVIYLITGESLLIKSPEVIERIKQSNNAAITDVLIEHAEELSRIFYRFKPLFLAMKKLPGAAPAVNRIRRLAKKNHIPLKLSILDRVTATIGTQEFEEVKKALPKELEKAAVFRKARLANAIKYRAMEEPNYLFRIRNGKFYAKHKPPKPASSLEMGVQMDAVTAHKLVVASLLDDLRSLRGKKIWMPGWIDYGIPTTEKQFVGGLPAHTRIALEELIVGVHWTDLPSGERVDLDLALLGIDGKLGWDGRLRDEYIQFSGDMTAAPLPDGAAEIFRIARTAGPKLLVLNWYNKRMSTASVPFKLFIAEPNDSLPTERSFRTHNLNFRVDPRRLCLEASLETGRHQQLLLGIIVQEEDEVALYLTYGQYDRRMSASILEHTRIANRALVRQEIYAVRLRELLQKLGAEIVSDKNEADVILDPNEMTTDLWLELLGMTSKTR